MPKRQSKPKTVFLRVRASRWQVLHRKRWWTATEISLYAPVFTLADGTLRTEGVVTWPARGYCVVR